MSEPIDLNAVRERYTVRERVIGPHKCDDGVIREYHGPSTGDADVVRLCDEVERLRQEVGDTDRLLEIIVQLRRALASANEDKLWLKTELEKRS